MSRAGLPPFPDRASDRQLTVSPAMSPLVVEGVRRQARWPGPIPLPTASAEPAGGRLPQHGGSRGITRSPLPKGGAILPDLRVSTDAVGRRESAHPRVVGAAAPIRQQSLAPMGPGHSRCSRSSDQLVGFAAGGAETLVGKSSEEHSAPRGRRSGDSRGTADLWRVGRAFRRQLRRGALLRAAAQEGQTFTSRTISKPLPPGSSVRSFLPFL